MRGKSSAGTTEGAVTTDQKNLLSRRAFTRRAVLLSASAALIPQDSLLSSEARAGDPAQIPDNTPKLSLQGQAEAEARFQLALSKYGSRLNDQEKRDMRTLIYFSQPGLERVRSFSLKNGDVPALFLKPIVEREKAPPATRPSSPPVAIPRHS